jgi:methylase of polypeptide subunit release factors
VPTLRTESDEPGPTRLLDVDDRLTADAALKHVRGGAALVYRGDFNNAKQLLAAMARRLPKPRPTASPLEAFRAERRARAVEHDTVSRLLVGLDAKYRLQLARAPDVAQACLDVWGPATEDSLVPLKTLLGMVGAAQWRAKGLAVPGLKGRLTPHWGVYAPTRTDYVELLASAGDVTDARVLDVGTGTGVLSFVLLQQGARHATATDVDPRAVACAQANAAALGLSTRFEALEADLFPPGDAPYDVIVSNPPWLPEAPKNRVDKAVFDEGGRFVRELLSGAAARLAPGGQVLLLLSDLAVLLGLRPADWLAGQLERAGLTLASRVDRPASHGKARDRSDPLFAARSREVTTLYRLTRARE